MKINLLHILIVLVALQSTIAVADLHLSHQTGNEHLEFNHIDNVDIDFNNEDFEKYSDSKSLNDNVTSYDCHHCCHCHGSHLTSLLPPIINVEFLYGNQSLPNLNQTIENAYLSRLLRPPKA
jgi:hypothetical protein